MPSRFCDNEDPCPNLRKAVSAFLVKDWDDPRFMTRLEDGNGKLVDSFMFQIMVVGRTKTLRVFIEYCPFCGTRVDPKFLEILRTKRS